MKMLSFIYHWEDMHTHFENPLLKINFLFYIIFQKCKKKYKEIITGHKLRQNLTVTISNSRARYSTERRGKKTSKTDKNSTLMHSRLYFKNCLQYELHIQSVHTHYAHIHKRHKKSFHARPVSTGKDHWSTTYIVKD